MDAGRREDDALPAEAKVRKEAAPERLLLDAGAPRAAVLAAALHDADVAAPGGLDDAAARFSPEVAAILAALREDTTAPWTCRIRRALDLLPRLSTDAALVAAAVRLGTLRGLRGRDGSGRVSVRSVDDVPYALRRRDQRVAARLLEARPDAGLLAVLVTALRDEVDALFPPDPPLLLHPLLDEVRRRSTGIGSHVHGEHHWQCVAQVGLWLCERDPLADPRVVLAFALLHDTMRENDHRDPEHGPRAAAFARSLHGEGLLALTDWQLAVLCDACERHTHGETSADPTTGACWDADRLNLWRCGIEPDQRFLSGPGSPRDALLERAVALAGARLSWDALAAGFAALA